MGWLRNTMDRLKEATAADPIECPRGWGQVAFTSKVDVAWPWWVSLDRRCPIGHVDSCASCRHPYNPAQIDALSERLTELESLRDRNGLTNEEVAYRRKLILQMRDGVDAARETADGFRITAWILGPLGAVITAAGAALAMLYHRELWFIGLGGAVMLALSVSFGVLSMKKNPDDENH